MLFANTKTLLLKSWVHEMQSAFIRRSFAATALNNLESIRAKTPPGQIKCLIA